MALDSSPKPEQERKRLSFPLLLGFGISVIWLLCFAIYAYLNFSELVELKPNSLGDFLAGVFAPLAFLWLFVATLLQRQELELQRQELKETREVMRLQKEEMSRAADETLEQTKIMKDNLRNEARRLEYENLDTRLYATALFIYSNRADYTLQTQETPRHFFPVFHEDKLGEIFISKENSDRVYALLHKEVRRFERHIKTEPNIRFQHANDGKDLVFSETRKRLNSLLLSISNGNELIEARLRGLNLEEIVSGLDKVIERMS